MLTYSYETTNDAIKVSLGELRPGRLRSLIKRKKDLDLNALGKEHRDLVFAIADLKALAEELELSISIKKDQLVLPHPLVAALSNRSAAQLGLPEFAPLVFETTVVGILGSSDFKLQYHWSKNGKRIAQKRTGCLITYSEGTYRLPAAVHDAVAIADSFNAAQADLSDHWAALARFRQSLQPDTVLSEPTNDSENDAQRTGEQQRIRMTEFLGSLRIATADSLAIRPHKTIGEVDFDPIPFYRGVSEQRDDPLSEDSSIVTGEDLARFHQRFRQRGATNAYQLDDNAYLVVDHTARPALNVMASMQNAPPTERAAFIKNPLPALTQAYKSYLHDRHAFEDLADEDIQSMIETAVLLGFTETQEYLDRVTGLGFWAGIELPPGTLTPTTWLPEAFDTELSEILQNATVDDLQNLLRTLQEAKNDGLISVNWVGQDVPVNDDVIQGVEAEIEKREKNPDGETNTDGGSRQGEQPRVVLTTQNNILNEDYNPEISPRECLIDTTLPQTITASLRPHQQQSFKWQCRCWQHGLQGILNADEQGLGKTLQTLAFLAWLQQQMGEASSVCRKPMLIVAPTSLLRNWEAEVETHMSTHGLGALTRIYGNSVSQLKTRGVAGMDTDDGEARLDLTHLHNAINDGRAHNHWLLTTYTTLANYQHSFHQIEFSTAVFDEIQAVKNPSTLRSEALRTIKADFRIGLTGTPVENSLTDLWAIIDQLSPGSLGALVDFNETYLSPEPEDIKLLHQRLFGEIHPLPPLAIRRLKTEAASDIPAKNRYLLPCLMRDTQAKVYSTARSKLANVRKGSALKMLHHIRAASLHPLLVDKSLTGDEDFVAQAAKLEAALETLHAIKESGERVLVFIEQREMQWRFIELAKMEFDLTDIQLINGATSVVARKRIVDRFQRHLTHDGGFDILVLSPKAAGVGLTLTAANHVIHLSRWWNPAVEEQCNDRVHRIGQHLPVSIHLPLAIHPQMIESSFDCLLQSLMQKKRSLAQATLWPMGDTSADVAALQNLLSQTDPVAASLGQENILEWSKSRYHDYKINQQELDSNGADNSSAPEENEDSELVCRVTAHENHVNQPNKPPLAKDKKVKKNNELLLVRLKPHGRPDITISFNSKSSREITLAGQAVALWPYYILPGAKWQVEFHD